MGLLSNDCDTGAIMPFDVKLLKCLQLLLRDPCENRPAFSLELRFNDSDQIFSFFALSYDNFRNSYPVHSCRIELCYVSNLCILVNFHFAPDNTLGFVLSNLSICKSRKDRV